MGNPLGTLKIAGRRSTVTLVVVLLAMTGLVAVLTSQLTHRILPDSTGVALASSPLDSSGGAVHDSQAVTGQLDILLAQLDEAWEQSDWGKSVEILTAILAADPGNTLMRDRLYQAHVNRGWQLLVDHALEAARSQFTLAQQLNTGGVEVQEGLRLLQQLVASGPTCPPPTAPPLVCTPVPQPTVVCLSPVVVATTCPSTAPVVCTPVPQPKVVCAPERVVVSACSPTPSKCSAFVCHVVRTGDTLFSLARRFNTTVEAIIAANNLPSCTIFICQKLLIPVCPSAPVCPTPCPPVCVPICPTPCPPVCPTPCPPVCVPVCPTPCPAVSAPPCPSTTLLVHVVQRGEDLFHLAIRFRVSVALLMQVNGLATTSLQPGRVIVIP